MSDILKVLKAAGQQSKPTPETIEAGAAAVAALRMQDAQTQQRLAAMRGKQARVLTPAEDTDTRMRLQELEREKEEMRQALEAVTEQLKRLGEQREKVIDPNERKLLERALLDEHKRSSQERLKSWREQLMTMPRTVINNPTDETIILTVNRVSIYVQPGDNEVPAAYEQPWLDHLESTKEGKARQRVLSAAMEYGDLADWINLGRHNAQSVDILPPFSE